MPRKKEQSEDAVERTVNSLHFAGLVRRVCENKSKAAEHAHDTSDRVRAAVDNDNLHRGAFGLIVKLARMDEYKRNDFLRQFELYLDIAREQKLFGDEHMGDLVDATHASDAESREDIGEKNAEMLAKGIKQLPEDDGADEPATPAKPPRRAAAVGDAPATTRFQ